MERGLLGRCILCVGSAAAIVERFIGLGGNWMWSLLGGRPARCLLGGCRMWCLLLFAATLEMLVIVTLGEGTAGSKQSGHRTRYQ
jgi:hypothetical protein